MADMYQRERGRIPDGLKKTLERIEKSSPKEESELGTCKECGFPYLIRQGKDGLCPDCLWVEEE